MNDLQIAADIAKCMADPMRLKILQFLSWGPASVAELVAVTGGSQPNVSNHLKLLRENELVRAEKNGRQVIYRVASPSIAEVINALSWAAIGESVPSGLAVTGKLADARTCYDHLAGRLGVKLLNGLANLGAITLPSKGWEQIEPGPESERIFKCLGIDLDAAIEQNSRRRFAFACPDWSEHGHTHIGGSLGAILYHEFSNRAWIKRDETKAITLTDTGKHELAWILEDSHR